MAIYQGLEEDASTKINKKKKLAVLISTITLLTLVVLSVYSSASGSSDDIRTTANGQFRRYEVGTGYVCNDGTPAVYYVAYADANSPNSDKWLIEFVGGGSCGSKESCDSRWETRSADMTTTSDEYAEFDEAGGLLCSDASKNPYFYDWNRVKAHYCTSDSWMGQQPDQWGWSFTGATNAFGIIEKLSKEHAFTSAKTFLFNGVSVGGTGILNLADGIDDYVKGVVSDSQRYFISDCGWTMTEWSCYGDECDDESTATTQGLYNNHNPYLNKNCEDAGLGWKCYYPEFMFKYILAKDRFIVAQQMYDSQMMPWAGIKQVSAWDDDTIEWCYARTDALLDSFKSQGVKNLFSSNCRTHDFTEHATVYDTTISNRGFADYLQTFLDADGGPSGTFYKTDSDHYPEANPTCDTDLLGKR